MKDKNNEIDVLKLSNELTIRRYLFNKEQISRVLSAPDYIALNIIRETETNEQIYSMTLPIIAPAIIIIPSRLFLILYNPKNNPKAPKP